MHYRMNNSNDYGHLRVRSNIVRLRGSQILSRVYLLVSNLRGGELRSAAGGDRNIRLIGQVLRQTEVDNFNIEVFLLLFGKHDVVGLQIYL